MTDNIITKDEAIDRMKAGLPCESRYEEYDWRETAWADFDINVVRFRKPPEPRRVARSWWVCLRPNGTWAGWSKSRPTEHEEDEELVHVREVLPGEVPMQMLGIDDARLSLHKAIHAIQFGNKTDDKLIIAQLADQGVYLARLIGEGS